MCEIAPPEKLIAKVEVNIDLYFAHWLFTFFESWLKSFINQSESLVSLSSSGVSAQIPALPATCDGQYLVSFSFRLQTITINIKKKNDEDVAKLKDEWKTLITLWFCGHHHLRILSFHHVSVQTLCQQHKRQFTHLIPPHWTHMDFSFHWTAQQWMEYQMWKIGHSKSNY